MIHFFNDVTEPNEVNTMTTTPPADPPEPCRGI
jgi:hypothetical protein